MNIPQRSLALAAGAAFALSFGTTAAPQKAAAWEPQKPVEFVIMAGQGGGADRLARFIQSIIEKHELSPMPFVPVNKAGGSGAEALIYMKEHAGDPHVVMATLNSYYTTPLRQPNLGVDIATFTPITKMADDTFQLWVHVDSGINSVEEYIAAVKAAGPQNWKMGGTGNGQEDSLVTAMLEQKFDIKMTYVPYSGGGTVAKELIGKHIDSTVNNPSEQVGFWDAGMSRPLASFTPSGLVTGKFGEIPTFADLGYGDDMVYFMQRSIIAPEGIDAEVQAFFVDVFEKVYNSEEWQSYMAEQGLIPGWLTGDALTEYFVEGREVHRRLLQATGEVM